jgi:hypothetical protein
MFLTVKINSEKTNKGRKNPSRTQKQQSFDIGVIIAAENAIITT